MSRLKEAMAKARKESLAPEAQLTLNTLVDGNGVQEVLNSLREICQDNARRAANVAFSKDWKRGAAVAAKFAIEWEKEFPDDLWQL